MQSIHETAEKIREKTEVIYTLDTLEYLARGGRIGRVKAIAGACSISSQSYVWPGWKIQHSNDRAHDWQIHQLP